MEYEYGAGSDKKSGCGGVDPVAGGVGGAEEGEGAAKGDGFAGAALAANRGAGGDQRDLRAGDLPGAAAGKEGPRRGVGGRGGVGGADEEEEGGVNDVLSRLGLSAETMARFTGKAKKGRAGRLGLPANVLSQMYADYQRLHSLSKVGVLWGRTRQSVYQIFKAHGLKREARNFQTKIVFGGRSFTQNKSVYYRAVSGDRRPLHHIMWEAQTGRAIPDGWQVGFKDGDPANLAAGNLHCLPGAEMRRFNAGKRYPSALLSAAQRMERRRGLQRDYMARRAAAFVAQGLRSDGKPRRRGTALWPALPKEKRSPRFATDYERMKEALGVSVQREVAA